MFSTYQNPVYPYRRSADQSAPAPAHHTLVVIGAGPVGLAAAIDAAQHGLSVVVLDDNNTVSVGSRAVCYAKRSLEIMNRLGCAEPMVAKGVTWQIGKVFFRDQLVRQFDLLPVPGHQQPAFINLQQYYLEEYLVRRAAALPRLQIRWNNKLSALSLDTPTRPLLTVDTPDGPYRISCDWLIAADGANSTVRTLMGLRSSGQVFQDRFLIADVVMQAEFPPERWFHFDPSYHRGQSTLLHSQPDNVWRLDFQLGWEADPAAEKMPEKILPRVRAMLGEGVDFELEWASVYTFTCRMMDRFKHGRVLFVGDAAHQVSPFGARGANSGFQDTDNLIWKLAAVLRGEAPEALLESFDSERVAAARENLLNSARATDFITPKSAASRTFRDAVLGLAREHDFARQLINSGRLSDPMVLLDSPLNSADGDPFEGEMVPGAVMSDAPVRGDRGEQWLLQVAGERFQLFVFCDASGALDPALIAAAEAAGIEPIAVLPTAAADAATPAARQLVDIDGTVAARYDARTGTAYLCRPDQHVVARWRHPGAAALGAAHRRALGHRTGERACH